MSTILDKFSLPVFLSFCESVSTSREIIIIIHGIHRTYYIRQISKKTKIPNYRKEFETGNICCHMLRVLGQKSL
jgi:uncharacterized membrane protein YgaE (UPF0421/DUF939 family)